LDAPLSWMPGAVAPFAPHSPLHAIGATYICLFHQINCVTAIKRILFYYRYLSIFVTSRVFVCSFLLPFMLRLAALRVGVKMLYNIFQESWSWHSVKLKGSEMASLVRECLCLFIYIFLTVPSLAFLLCLHVD